MTLEEQVTYVGKKINQTGDAWIAKSITDKEYAAVVKDMATCYPIAMAAYRKDLMPRKKKA